MNIVATCHMTSRGFSYAVVYEVKVKWPAVSRLSVWICPSLGVKLPVADVVKQSLTTRVDFALLFCVR